MGWAVSEEGRGLEGIVGRGGVEKEQGERRGGGCTLVVPHLPVHVRALAADVREVEDDAVPLLALADLLLRQLCCVDGVEDGLTGGEEDGDVGGGLWVPGVARVCEQAWSLESAGGVPVVVVGAGEGAYFCSSSSSLSKHVARTLAQPWWVTSEAAKEKSPGQQNQQVPSVSLDGAYSTFPNKEYTIMRIKWDRWLLCRRRDFLILSSRRERGLSGPGVRHVGMLLDMLVGPLVEFAALGFAHSGC